jgi:hypothetical protein
MMENSNRFYVRRDGFKEQCVLALPISAMKPEDKRYTHKNVENN